MGHGTSTRAHVLRGHRAGTTTTLFSFCVLLRFYFVEAVFFFFFFSSSSSSSSSSSVRISTNSLLPSSSSSNSSLAFIRVARRTGGAPRTRGRREARRRRRTRILVRCRRKACYLQRSSGRCRWKKWKAKSALLKRWSVKELAREVKANHASKCPHSKAKFKGPPPLEKEELVEVVLSLRGDPMCSVCFEQFVEMTSTFACYRRTPIPHRVRRSMARVQIDSVSNVSTPGGREMSASS